jgi:hypothetical protein
VNALYTHGLVVIISTKRRFGGTKLTRRKNSRNPRTRVCGLSIDARPVSLPGDPLNQISSRIRKSTIQTLNSSRKIWLLSKSCQPCRSSLRGSSSGT